MYKRQGLPTLVSIKPHDISDIDLKNLVENVNKKNSLRNKDKISSKDNLSLVETEFVEKTKQNKDVNELDISKDNWNVVFNTLDLNSGTKQLASHCSFVKKENTEVTVKNSFEEGVSKVKSTELDASLRE